MRAFFIVILLSLFCSIGHAQEDRGFVADRPGATDSPLTTLPGSYRIESGLYSFSRQNQDGVRTTEETLGNIVFVAGVTRSSELHFGFDSYVRRKLEANGKSEEESGFGDMILKYKVNVIGNDGGDVAFGIIPQLSYGSKLNGSNLLGGVGLPVAFGLPQNFSFSVTPQWNLEEKDPGGHYSSQYLGVLLGYGWTENLEVFLDYASVSSEEDPFESVAGIGFAHQIRPNVQWDLSLNAGLSEAASDLTLSAGLIYAGF